MIINFKRIPTESHPLEYKLGYYIYQFAITAGKGNSRLNTSNQEIFAKEANKRAKILVENKLRIKFEKDIDIKELINDPTLKPEEKGEKLYELLVNLQVEDGELMFLKDIDHKSMAFGNIPCREGTKCERSGILRSCGCYLENGKWVKCESHKCN